MTTPPKRPISFFANRIAVALSVIVLIVFAWLWSSNRQAIPKLQLFSGKTMGTSYHIRLIPPSEATELPGLQAAIDDELLKVNQQMSTYLADSELSEFNRQSSTEWYPVSIETSQVCAEAKRLSEISGQVYDVTVGPLVNLWGFGKDGHHSKVPTEEEIARAKQAVGNDRFDVKLDPPAIKKQIPEVEIDLSSIAKGHGVDRLCQLLDRYQIENYFVEIGGEIRTRGLRPDGKKWQIGIERPTEEVREGEFYFGLSGKALATSGDYRNFFVGEGGKRYSHTIDPKSGRPVTHELASASVIADTCATADGIATVMMCLGPERGMQIAEQENWMVFLIVRKEEGFEKIASKAFREFLPEVNSQLSDVSDPN